MEEELGQGQVLQTELPLNPNAPWYPNWLELAAKANPN